MQTRCRYDLCLSFWCSPPRQLFLCLLLIFDLQANVTFPEYVPSFNFPRTHVETLNSHRAWIKSVECIGTEMYIHACPREVGAGWASTSACTRSTDVGVCCQRVDCQAGTFHDRTSASNDTCVACPSGSTSEPSSNNVTDCKCNAGYTGPDGLTCAACEAGKYKAVNGSDACLSCRSGSSSPPGSDNVTDCKCNAGYKAVNGMAMCTLILSPWNCSSAALARPIRVIKCGTSGNVSEGPACPNASITSGFGFYALDVYSGTYDGLLTIPAAGSSWGGILSQVSRARRAVACTRTAALICVAPACSTTILWLLIN